MSFKAIEPPEEVHGITKTGIPGVYLQRPIVGYNENGTHERYGNPRSVVQFAGHEEIGVYRPGLTLLGQLQLCVNELQRFDAEYPEDEYTLSSLVFIEKVIELQNLRREDRIRRGVLGKQVR